MVITYDFVIIGGGIIGENILYAIKKHTNNVLIIDEREGYKASHAAGGMLGAQNEFFEDNALFQLSMIGQQIMPEHVSTLEQLSGQSIDLKQHGLLKIASDDGFESLKRQFQFLKYINKSVTWVDDLSQFANSNINPNFQHAMWISTDGQVNALKYLSALREVNKLIPHLKDRVININDDQQSYLIETTTQAVRTKNLIIAAGCNSDNILKMMNIPFKMDGVKGDVLTLYHPYLHLEETLFQTNGHYIVPKANNTYLVGANTSNKMSKTPCAEGIAWLLNETFSLVPKLREATLLNVSCGFRPNSHLNRPIIDQLNERTYIATGHYRNGILLSRVTGELMRQMIFDHEGALNKQYHNQFKLGEYNENLY